ncbi:MAG: gamma-glutamylcyclotransferase family protein [Geminicoccaceae bacterium]|nr:gamma-glutamylcyclotransferase family protein [Geminicoccaceae bacterium]
MAFFFFGTLRDPEVLALVLDRRPERHDLVRASLAGYTAVRATAQPYPLLVPAADASVEGLVLRCPSQRDEARITWFEEDEFQAEWRTVESAEGPLRARVFFALEPVLASGIRWDYQRWREAEKTRYLEQCVGWMRELDDP